LVLLGHYWLTKVSDLLTKRLLVHALHCLHSLRACEGLGKSLLECAFHCL
jgi:hypothetical protein